MSELENRTKKEIEQLCMVSPETARALMAELARLREDRNLKQDLAGQYKLEYERIATERDTLQRQLSEARGGLQDIKKHMEIAMKGEHRMSTVWQIADMKLAAIEAAKGEKNDSQV